MKLRSQRLKKILMVCVIIVDVGRELGRNCTSGDEYPIPVRRIEEKSFEILHEGWAVFNGMIGVERRRVKRRPEIMRVSREINSK